MAASQGLVLAFLLERGGRARNSELLAAFRDFVNSSEPAERSRNRDLFKKFVNSVAVVQQVGDVKYVVVKKRYQEVATGNAERTGGTAQQCHRSMRAVPTQAHADALNHSNNPQPCLSTSPNAACCTARSRMRPHLHLQSSADGDAGMIPPSAAPTTSLDDSLTPAVLNVSSNGRTGKTGVVFAVVAIKSPPLPYSRCDGVTPVNEAPVDDVAAQSQSPSFEVADKSTALGNSWSYPSAGHLYRSLRSRRRQSLVPSSPSTKRCAKVTKPGFDAKSWTTLEPREHEWLVKSATGRWGRVSGLLLQDVRLVESRNFISGFTVLHWAAKKGNSRVIRQVLDLSRQAGLEVDVNAKSHDGYTALHVAAIHSHEAVLDVLVRSYGAKCNVRDNSGKKPYHYLGKDASVEVRKMLGDHQVAECGRSDDEQRLSDVPKGFNTFSKLFQPSVGHGPKKKARHRPSFHFINDDQDGNRSDYAALSRGPLH